MQAKKIDHVVVATPDPTGAAATFRGHFELPPAAPITGSPALTIGQARIAFITPQSGSALAAALGGGSEGLAEVCMEVASLADAEAALRNAGIAFTVETKGANRAVAVDPSAAHGVRLTLVEGSIGA